MAHNIEIRNGEASMFYIDEPPWHGLGTKLDKPATAEEALRFAKLDWGVMKVPLYAHHNNCQLLAKDKFAIVREDLWGTEESDVLGIVSGQYRPLQNREAFKFFDPIVGEDAAIYHTAGILGNGERIWILVKLPDDIRVVGDDVANKYLLLSNSHDGSSAVQVKFTPIRVVCQNTLTMALSQGPTIRVTHTKNMQERLKQAEHLLGIVRNHFSSIENTFREMAVVKMNNERLTEYFRLVFPEPKDPDNEKGFKRVRENRLLAEHFFEHGRGTDIRGITGTLWSAYNGVAELIDHRSYSRSKDRRLNSIWFGDGYLTKARAFRIATSKVKGWTN